MTPSRCLLLVLLAQVAWPAGPGWETLGPELKHLLRESRENFHTVEGARIENRRRDSFFEAKTYLPEASYCRIFQQGGTVYCCEWDGRGASAATALFGRLVGQIEGVLGAEWSKTEKKTARRQEVLFRGEDKPLVHVILQSSPVQVYVVVLPPGGPKDGLTGEIPSIVEFVHP
jgi:hypothetical protein